jgi:hypothetical protein
VEVEFIDTIIGISDSRTEIVMLAAPRRRHPAGAVEVRSARPRARVTGRDVQRAGAAQPGLRSRRPPGAAVDRLAAEGYGLIGGIGQYEHIWRMAYVRGPEGIIVSLAERIG